MATAKPYGSKELLNETDLKTTLAKWASPPGIPR